MTPRRAGSLADANPAAADAIAPDGAALWTLAIFAAREAADELTANVLAMAAVAARPTCIDVMVNGNAALAEGMALTLPQVRWPNAQHTVRLWSVSLGGKAHTWNQYVHLVWPGSVVAFFADGYVRPEQHAMQRLAGLLDASPLALGGTGVPLTGSTAAQMKQLAKDEGALHGNFFALKRSTMQGFQAAGFKLPLGLYGFDTLLGAVLGFGADPSRYAWNAQQRIVSSADIAWHTPEKHWWSGKEVKTQFNRILNNALRQLVRESTKYYLQQQKMDPGALPKTIEDFVLTWARARPQELARTLWRSPLSRLALHKMQTPREWSQAATAPRLLCVCG